MTLPDPFIPEPSIRRNFERIDKLLNEQVLSLLYAGAGDPENSVTAPVGALYLRTDGGASTTLYVKEANTDDTGWVGK